MSGRRQPPQPQYVVQLPVSADLTGRPRSRSVVLAQELVMKPHREHAQDLDRVVGIKLVHRLSAHTPAGYQRMPSAPVFQASVRSHQPLVVEAWGHVLAAAGRRES